MVDYSLSPLPLQRGRGISLLTQFIFIKTLILHGNGIDIRYQVCYIECIMDIKKLRKALKMSQEEMAGKLGVSTMTIRRWEAKTNKPSRLALRQLARLERKAGK